LDDERKRAKKAARKVAHEAREDRTTNRSENTSRAYGAWIGEYMAWCKAKAGTWLNGVLMGEDKIEYSSTLPLTDQVVVFVKNYVTVRPKRCGGKKGGIRKGTKLDNESVYMAIKAIVDNYQTARASPDQQTRRLMKDQEHPRNNDTISSIMDQHKREKSARNKKMYVDRGKNRADFIGYTVEQHAEICRLALFDGANRWDKTKKGYRYALVPWFSHIFRHTMALRGDSLRKCQFPDFCVLPGPPDEGTQTCQLLAFVHDNGKNNPNGHADFSATMR